MNLDFVTGVICLLIAFCLAGIHVLTSPRRGHWQTLPHWVRYPLFPAAGIFLVRAINLFQLAMRPDAPLLGHANMEAVWATASILWLVASYLALVIYRTYPIRVWQRIAFLHSRMDQYRGQNVEPDEVVALLRPEEVAAVLKMRGGVEVAEPPSHARGAWDDAPARVVSIR